MSKLMTALFAAGLGFAGIGAADAKSEYENTPSARENARDANAQATYKVAIEECADFAGNRRNTCVQEARAEFTESQTGATVERGAANDAPRDAAATPRVVHNQGYSNMRDAEYAVVIEECDPHAGPVRNACVSNANLKFGKH
jgi:hypothetical protein